MYMSYLRGEHRLSVTASTVLRKIFWSNREDVTGCHKKSRNEELDLFSLTSSKRGECGWCAM